ncbi:unnamed protein product [Wuchereria bancrofti]|uniref:DNA replication complex GINS protein SLD5 n=1 Tax=Wuchereria bancrofti TaxID=6293 RepID=A0A3P7FND7_WUCBA|nr:unnamed protein product [Wuchereria bancrofti]
MTGRFSMEEEDDCNITMSAVNELRLSSESQIANTMDEIETMNDNDDESITPSQLVKEITIAWQNEICAPRLLPHIETIVDLMIDQLESMEENFSKCKDHTSLKIILHKMEVQRLAYIINEYIRARLKKDFHGTLLTEMLSLCELQCEYTVMLIAGFPITEIKALTGKLLRIEKDVEVLQNEDIEREKTNAPRLLSSAERVFAERYELIKRHLMETNFLERIPPALQRLPTTALDMSAERVIVEVTNDQQEQVIIPEMTDMLSDRTIDLLPGSIHFIPYPSIANLLEANKVRLL